MLSVNCAQFHIYAFYAECHYAECHYAECHYAECHYAECHYAECRGTEWTSVNIRLGQKWQTLAHILANSGVQFITVVKCFAVQAPQIFSGYFHLQTH